MKLTRQNLSSLLPVFIILLLAVIIALLIIFAPKLSTNSEDIPPTELNATSTDTYFVFREKNFKFIPAPDWQAMKTSEINLPSGITGAYFGFKRSGTSCVLAYVHTTASSLDKYNQTSFADIIFTSAGKRIDSSWYVPAKNLPDNFSFNGYQKIPLPGEARLVYYPVSFNSSDPNYNNVFLLFDQNNGMVSNQCDEEASSMLKTLEPVAYELADVSATSAGFLYLSQNYDDARSPHLLFLADNDPIVKEVLSLDITENPMPAVYNDKIYFVQKGILKSLDVFSKTIADIQGLNLKDGEIINDFYFSNNNLFYLAGPSCLEYMAKCNLKLFKYDFNDQSNRLLADRISSRYIVAVDTGKNTIEMAYTEGDAGCFWGSSEAYDMTLGKLQKNGSFSGCEGDKKVDVSFQRLNDLEKLGESHMQSLDYLRLDEGRLLAPDKAISSFEESPWKIRYVK